MNGTAHRDPADPGADGIYALARATVTLAAFMLRY
jgi:hypothetical protein